MYVGLAERMLGKGRWCLMHVRVNRSRGRIVPLDCFFSEMRRLIEWRWEFSRVGCGLREGRRRGSSF